MLLQEVKNELETLHYDVQCNLNNGAIVHKLDSEFYMDGDDPVNTIELLPLVPKHFKFSLKNRIMPLILSFEYFDPKKQAKSMYIFGNNMSSRDTLL